MCSPQTCNIYILILIYNSTESTGTQEKTATTTKGPTHWPDINKSRGNQTLRAHPSGRRNQQTYRRQRRLFGLLPAEIVKLANLKNLDFSNNKLTTLPGDRTNDHKLQWQSIEHLVSSGRNVQASRVGQKSQQI